MHCMGYFSKFPPPSFAGNYFCSYEWSTTKLVTGVTEFGRFPQRLFDSD